MPGREAERADRCAIQRDIQPELVNEPATELVASFLLVLRIGRTSVHIPVRDFVDHGTEHLASRTEQEHRRHDSQSASISEALSNLRVDHEQRRSSNTEGNEP